MALICGAAAGPARAASAPAPSPPAEASRRFVEAHCLSCHSEATRSGGLDLEKLLSATVTGAEFAQWVKVHDRVRSGEMPPAKGKKPRPPEAETAAMLRGLSDSLVKTQEAWREKDGRAVVRRLNVTEYENSLRDLLHLPGLNVKNLLPEDGRAYGYDRSAEALDISPILLEKYGAAADAALDQAVAQWSTPPLLRGARMYPHQNYDYIVVLTGGDGVILKDMKYDLDRFPIPSGNFAGGKFKGMQELKESKVLEAPGTTGMFRRIDGAFAGRIGPYAPMVPGRYRVTTSVWSFWWDRGEVQPSPRDGAAGIYYGDRLLGFVDAPSLKPTRHQFDVWLEPGSGLKFDPASLWSVHVYHRQGGVAAFSGPGVAMDWIELEGPIHDEWPPASHKRLFGDLPLVPFSSLGPSEPRPKRVPPRPLFGATNWVGSLTFATVRPSKPAAAASQLLKGFLQRAFRRPVAKEEVARYATLATKRMAAGDCFEDAMKAAYKAALCSPDFLFLSEPVGPLDQWSLASRLSYFLWNSMPDEDLFAAAGSGKLRDPDALRARVDRMLADPRSDRFVADFLDQWLDLRDFDRTTPDLTLYPEYTPYLSDAIRREPRAYLRELLAKDLPAACLVQSDFLMVNQRLAEHYGIDGVTGTQFRRVKAPPGSHRGGFLTQAAVLKVTANGTTTSPVKRGSWVLKKIVGRPPDPPPADIPAIEPDVRGATTIREQLAKHRSNTSCAACHAKIDPPGFALESFDVIGTFRDHYRATAGPVAPDLTKLFPSHLDPSHRFPDTIYGTFFRVGPAVDPHGETAEGRAFGGIDEFKKILLADPRDIARNFTEQLVTYATGVPVEFADRAAVERILDKCAPSFGVNSLAHEVVLSPLFLNK